MSTTRREFLATTASLAAGAVAVSTPGLGFGQATTAPDVPLAEIPELKTPESTKEGDMLFRTFGNTKEKISLLGLGGHHFGNFPSQEPATKFLRRAIDSGVNFLDNCWSYHNGNSEVMMGKALLDGYRKKVFLMTKLDGRTKAASESQLNDSLKRLQVETIDLLQIHENIRMEDAEHAFGKNGCIETYVAAQKAGKIRYIGFTGHKDPAIHLNMLDVAKKNHFRFDSVQMPINVLDAHFRSFSREVVPRLVKEGIAVLAMKTMAGGGILRNRVTATECLYYAMTLPSSTVIRGMDSEEFLTDTLAAVKAFKPYEAKEMAALLARMREVAMAGNVEIFKTTNRYDGTVWSPQWLGL